MKLSHFKLLFISIVIYCFNTLYSAHSVQAQDRFSVLSWNILGPTAPDARNFLDAMERYSDHTKRLEDVVYALDSWDADIVCLQEVTQATLNTLGTLLNDILSDKYFLAAWSLKGTSGGVAVLVKHNLVTDNNKQNLQEYVEREFNQQPEIKDPKKKHFGAAYAELEFKDRTNVLICSVHLSRANHRSKKASNTGLQQLHFVMSDLKKTIGENNQLPVIIAGDFNTFYEEVLHSYIPYIEHFTKFPWKMFEHKSFTAGEVNGSVSSIDHVLYRCLNIRQQDSWIFGDLYLHAIEDLEDKVYVRWKSFDEVADNNSRIAISGDSINAIKTYELFLPEATGKSFLMKNQLRVQNPSDHLPIYVVFEKSPVKTDESIDLFVDSLMIGRALNLGRAVKKYSDELVGKALSLSKIIMQHSVPVVTTGQVQSLQQPEHVQAPRQPVHRQDQQIQQVLNPKVQPKQIPNQDQQLPQQPVQLRQEPNQPRSCSYTYKFPDGTAEGPSHINVGRAGVLLVVPTGKNNRENPFENYGIIVGHDKNLGSWMVAQAGRVESKHKTTAETAADELREETGDCRYIINNLKLTSNNIVKLPYLYAQPFHNADGNQLFIYKTDDTNLITEIRKSVQAAQANPNLGHAYKEIDEVEIVSLDTFMKLLSRIDTAILPKNAKGQTFFPSNLLEVRTISGRNLQVINRQGKHQGGLSYPYTVMFSYPGTTRYQKTQEMFRKLLH